MAEVHLNQKNLIMADGHEHVRVNSRSMQVRCGLMCKNNCKWKVPMGNFFNKWEYEDTYKPFSQKSLLLYSSLIVLGCGGIVPQIISIMLKQIPLLTWAIPRYTSFLRTLSVWKISPTIAECHRGSLWPTVSEFILNNERSQWFIIHHCWWLQYALKIQGETMKQQPWAVKQGSWAVIYSGAQMKCNWEILRYLNNWCCNLNESKGSPKVLSEVGFMRWFTGYKVRMVLPWGVYLWICQFWTFSINFFMEFDVDHLKEPFFLSIIAFCLIKKCGHIHEL